MAQLNKKRELRKPCMKCNKSVLISKFYINRLWKEEMFRDAWCKDCIRAYVYSEETLKEYCIFNKRVFKEDLYMLALNKVEETISLDKEYTECVDLDKKNAIYCDKVFTKYFQFMNTRAYYQYADTVAEDDMNAIKDLKEKFKTTMEYDYGKKLYNQFWRGKFTEMEIEYLEEYFAGLQRDFKLDNHSHIDYAKKVSKSSLAMDQAYNDMLNGVIGAEKRYKDCKDIFDQLSQSAKFAEKTRSENDSVGFGSLGELIKKMETDGFLQNEIKFPEDDIDRVINAYRWVISSVGEEY
jgi:hypothetical protein